VIGVPVSSLRKRLMTSPRQIWGSLYPFLQTNGRIWREMWKGKRASLFHVILLMIFTAWVRMFMIVLLAGAAHVLGNNGTVDLLGLEISLGSKLEAVILMAAFMAAITFAATWTSYEAERRIWALGRWMNELAASRTDEIIRMGPQLQSLMRFARPANINVLMTQVPMHVGMAAVTLVRMLNPVTLMVFAGAVIVFKQPLIAISILAIAACIVPFYVAQSLSIQANSKKFYTNAASAYGIGVNRRISLLNSQSGVAIPANLSKDVVREPYYKEYMDAFDRNVLANELIMMVVSFTGVLLVPLLFLVLGLMYSYGHFSLGSLITTIGAVLYLITSARSVASNITNLIRFFSQARLHHRLLDAAEDATRRAQQRPPASDGELPAILHLELRGNEAGIDTVVVRLGESVLLSVEEPISNFSLGAVVAPLVESAALPAALYDQLSFVGSTYRFGEGTVWEHLTARKPEASLDEVEQCCGRLNALESFRALPLGLQTPLNEDAWNALDWHARLALRTVPLILSPTALVIIDSAVVQGAGSDAFAGLLAEFDRSFVFVTVTAGNAIPEFGGRACGVVAGGRLLGWGDRSWFLKAHPKKARQASAAATDDEVLQTMLSTG
jgi:ABC-type multidrug transport system fused ATPase/permease subunit